MAITNITLNLPLQCGVSGSWPRLIVKWEMLLESANWKCHFTWLADIFLKVLLNILFAPAIKMSKSSLTSGFYPKAGKADITRLCVWCQTAHTWVKCRLICHCLCCLFFAQRGESQQRLVNCLQYNWSCLPGDNVMWGNTVHNRVA